MRTNSASSKIWVINAKEEQEQFSFNKVYNSVRRCGVSKELALLIAQQIKKEAFPGISTLEIYDRIFEILGKKSPISALRYNLKTSIEKLGPTGFPFEKFVGKIFEAEGFEVKLNQIIPGFCTKYEIDFVARKENQVFIGECKFRHVPGGRVELQASLANYARFLDIKDGGFLNSHLKYNSILVTNAKFTNQAITYSECVGVKLLGWKYPLGRGMEKLIEKNNLFPITILPSVSSYLAKVLIENEIILVKDVFSVGFKNLKIAQKNKIKKEAEILLKNSLNKAL